MFKCSLVAMVLLYLSTLTCLLTIFMVNSQITECKSGYFKLDEMKSCHPYLGCEIMDNVNIIKRLGTGAVKDVFLINWKQYSIVLSIPVNINYLEDFINGKNMLQLLNPSKHIVQLLGFCDERNVIFTEYHPNGNTAEFFCNKIHPLNTIESLHFCYQYSLILNQLHFGPAGRLVFCDSNSLNKLLSQLLVTSDGRIILNDVDALTEVKNGSGIKCGHKQLKGSFVAPEQLWKGNDPFNDLLMTGYDEKTDIWKAADVCEYFLKQAKDSEVIKFMLHELHSKCKSVDPHLRPTSKHLLQEYEGILKKFSNSAKVEL